MTIKLEQNLEKIGLTAKEAKVYLATLALGPATAQQIAVKATIERPTTYVAIESLMGRGLLSAFMRGKKRQFQAESPSSLERLVQEEKRRVAEKESNLAGIMQELVAVSGAAKDQPLVSSYEGEEGARRVRQTILESGTDAIEQFSPLDLAEKHLPPSESERRLAARKGRHVRLIYSSEDKAGLPSKEGNVERLRIPHDKYPFEGDVIISGNRVGVIYYAPKLAGVIIEHKGIANTFRQMFALIWDARR